MTILKDAATAHLKMCPFKAGYCRRYHLIAIADMQLVSFAAKR